MRSARTYLPKPRKTILGGPFVTTELSQGRPWRGFALRNSLKVLLRVKVQVLARCHTRVGGRPVHADVEWFARSSPMHVYVKRVRIGRRRRLGRVLERLFRQIHEALTAVLGQNDAASVAC